MKDLDVVLEALYAELVPEGNWDNLPYLNKFRAKELLKAELADLKYYYEEENDKAWQEGYEQGYEQGLEESEE